MELRIDNITLNFVPVEINFQEATQTDVFARSNNKTLKQAVAGRRYASLAPIVSSRYAEHLNRNLGDFLLELKGQGDPFYQSFLNKYGDAVYYAFSVEAKDFANRKGLYLYTVGDQIKYIGRCNDNFRSRNNAGYGNITPKNCYKDGRATNCRLNALIGANRAQIALYICPLDSKTEIDDFEKALIRKYQPKWNKVLFREKV